MDEEWRAVEGYDGYEVSNAGNVRSFWRRMGRGLGRGFGVVLGDEPQVLKPGKVRNGYFWVTLCRAGTKKNFLVSRLVATAFLPNHDKLLWVDHINRNKEDNRVENLRWCSPQQSQHNKKQRADNTSGHTGITILKQGNKKFATQWREDGRTRGKCFETLEEAIAHRAEMERLHYDQEFYNAKRDNK